MANTETVLKIKGCSDCPLCDMNDMSRGYTCRISDAPNNQIEDSEFYMPITPEWCPIKNNKVSIIFDNEI